MLPGSGKSRSSYLKEGYPPQGLSEARRARRIFGFSGTDPPRGRPAGGGGVHHRDIIVKNHHDSSNTIIFLGII